MTYSLTYLHAHVDTFTYVCIDVHKYINLHTIEKALAFGRQIGLLAAEPPATPFESVAPLGMLSNRLPRYTSHHGIS